jgi:transcriptional regulator with XRE-family HTH domain
VSTFVVTSRQIRAARGLLGWTQADLAKASGLSRSTIAAIERDAGNPTHDIIDRIRVVLENSQVEFLAQEGVRFRHPIIHYYYDDLPDANQRLLENIYLVASQYNLQKKLQKGTNEILIFGLRAEEDSQNSVGDDYLTKHLERLKDAGLQEKILCGPDARTFVAPRASYRRLPELDPSQDTVHIYGDRVATIRWRPKEFVITIESEPIASALRSMFNLLWKLHGGID